MSLIFTGEIQDYVLNLIPSSNDQASVFSYLKFFSLTDYHQGKLLGTQPPPIFDNSRLTTGKV